MSGEALIRRAETADCIQKSEHPGYEFEKRVIVGKEDSEHFDVSIYEVPPGKAAVPYHYHMRNEEVFFILSGTGRLKSPEGERMVSAGDFLYFPNNESGAHKLTNVSENEKLIYADFDIRYDPEVAFYPDSDKVSIFGKGTRLILPISQQMNYYDGE
jgi:uncharacterized cupin superfamily protein